MKISPREFSPLRRDEARRELYGELIALEGRVFREAMVDAPGSGGYRLNVLACRVEQAAGAPGAVLECDREGPLVAAGSGAVRLLTVQPEGRQPMDGGSFLRGHSCREGDLLR